MQQGIDEVARLFHENQITSNTLANSKTLQIWYRRMGFGTINCCSIHDKLERHYHNVVHSIKTILKERKSDKFLWMSFDNWKADGNIKYIGAYLYFRSQKICLGLVRYARFFGSAEISDLLKQRLTLFDISLSNVDLFTTDMGSDVQRFARIENKFTFPCLAHVINLFAKCIVLNMDEVDDDDHDETDVLIDENDLVPIIRRVRSKVREYRRTPTLEE